MIDDWVLLGFLVGNDFVPHLPNMHIQLDVLPYLWGIYKSTLPDLDGALSSSLSHSPTLSLSPDVLVCTTCTTFLFPPTGYLNEGGTLVLSRFEIFMRKLDRVSLQIFLQEQSLCNSN